MTPAQNAWEHLAKSPKSRWAAEEEPALAPVSVEHKPSFSFDKSASIFCVGSCFARNIEEHLATRGIEPLSRRVFVPRSEWENRPSGLLNKFTIKSALNELKWVLEPFDVGPDFFEVSSKGVRDLQLAPPQKLVDIDRAIARRNEFTTKYFRQLLEADIIIFTLGLNEVWHDNHTNFSLNAAPSRSAVSADPSRYHFYTPRVTECVDDLCEFYDALKAARKKPFHFVVTVSPVPLNATATGEDIRIANTISKSTLRVAANELIALRPDCIYFPSYEMITGARKDLAFAQDERHVKNSVVRDVVGKFIADYFGDLPILVPEDFSEFAYLQANPDIDDAVRKGEMISGIQHFIHHGKNENRRTVPEEPVTALINAGALE